MSDIARVRAKGDALCPDFDAMDRDPPLRRKLGRAYEEVSPGQWAWTPTMEAATCTKRAEVARAIADGDLWPADAETAAWAFEVTRVPVAFDPTFGGSLPPSEPIATKAARSAAKESGQ